MQPSSNIKKTIADFFGVSVAYLNGEADAIYPRSTTTDVRTIADDVEMLHKSPELRVLLSASAKLTKSDVEAITEIALRMNKERDEG